MRHELLIRIVFYWFNLYLINVYLYIKYVAQSERKKNSMNILCLKFVTQTKLLDRLIGQARLLKMSDQTLNKAFDR